jgi:hypothetical protein
MAVKSMPGCRICALGDERERVLIAIERNPKTTKTAIVKNMHVTRSKTKQREIFESIPFIFKDGIWTEHEREAA